GLGPCRAWPHFGPAGRGRGAAAGCVAPLRSLVSRRLGWLCRAVPVACVTAPRLEAMRRRRELRRSTADLEIPLQNVQSHRVSGEGLSADASQNAVDLAEGTWRGRVMRPRERGRVVWARGVGVERAGDAAWRGAAHT